MFRKLYQPCIPTRGTEVPTGREWYHEVKYDGYRMLVQRDGKRVRLLTRNGHDWTDRYPLIVEAALKNRHSSFVIDGEAVLLGVDGPTSMGYTRANTMKRSSFTPSISWRSAGTICASFHYRCAKQT